MTVNDVQKYEKLKSQIDNVYIELSLLLKKNPNTAISSFKLKIVNSLLEVANTLLNDSDKPFEKFSLFGSETLPTNSDVMVMLSQYRECLSKLKYKNVTSLSGKWYWVINKKTSKIRTTCPLEFYIM